MRLKEINDEIQSQQQKQALKNIEAIQNKNEKLAKDIAKNAEAQQKKNAKRINDFERDRESDLNDYSKAIKSPLLNVK